MYLTRESPRESTSYVRGMRAGAPVEITITRPMILAGMAILDYWEDAPISQDALVYEVFLAMVTPQPCGAIRVVGREAYL